MATFVKFEVVSENILEKVHNFSAAGDTLKVYLSNTAPNAATMAVKADLAEITNQNGYTAPIDIENDTSRTGATTSVTTADTKTVTASGGAVGPFRYAVIYNDTPTSPADPLIGYYDYGSSITLQAGESFVVDFGTSLFTLA